MDINKFYTKFIKNHDRIFPEWFFKMALFMQIEILEAHFIITDMCFNYEFMAINLELLEKLRYFRQNFYILFADQIEVVKRNISSDKPIPKFQLTRFFEPEEMFIEQCKSIKLKREEFIKKVGENYQNIGQKLAPEKNNIDELKKQQSKLLKQEYLF